jgi:hypothetical protein
LRSFVGAPFLSSAVVKQTFFTMLQFVWDQILAIEKFEFPGVGLRLHFNTCYALENDGSPGPHVGEECSRTYEEPERKENAKPRGWEELERLARQPTFIDQFKDSGYKGPHGSPRGIMDLLGWYNPEFPDSVFMCHKNIMAWALKSGVPFHCVWDVVCIHELAHLIHHRVNPDQFQAGHPLFPSRADFVEGWAQYCTWIVVQALGGWHETAFNRLVQGQPAEYHYYKLFVHHRDKASKASVVKLFFCEYGWIEAFNSSFAVSLPAGSNELEAWIPSGYLSLLIAHLQSCCAVDRGAVGRKLVHLCCFEKLSVMYSDIMNQLPFDPSVRDNYDTQCDLNSLGFCVNGSGCF